MIQKAAQFQKILDQTVDHKKIFGTSFAVQKGQAIWTGAAGNMSTDQAFFIASTTKLFTSALIFQLRAEGKLAFSDPIRSYLDPTILANLHVYKGKEYSYELTIEHLLAHTSGLPDYFQGKGPSGKSLEDELKAGHDQYWTFEEAIARTKTMQARFAPGTPKKAHYSDANFQLLGKIIEVVTQKSYAENCQERVMIPLGLKKTYVYQDATDRGPQTLIYKNEELPIFKAMTSFGADGGVVSTALELLHFVEAFFTGKLFPEAYIDEIQKWNRIFFPMRSGIGMHQFKLPWIFNPTGAVPSFIGHSGLSGALAYYCPKEKIWIAGTVNQIAYPDRSFKTMIKLARLAMK